MGLLPLCVWLSLLLPLLSARVSRTSYKDSFEPHPSPPPTMIDTCLGPTNDHITAHHGRSFAFHLLICHCAGARATLEPNGKDLPGGFVFCLSSFDFRLFFLSFFYSWLCFVSSVLPLLRPRVSCLLQARPREGFNVSYFFHFSFFRPSLILHCPVLCPTLFSFFFSSFLVLTTLLLRLHYIPPRSVAKYSVLYCPLIVRKPPQIGAFLPGFYLFFLRERHL